MNAEIELTHYLEPLQLEAWQFHPVVGSTNDIALDWARNGGPDWGLVIADHQKEGRGRNGRKWVTKAGAGLAFSLVMLPTPQERTMLPRFTALAALGLIRVLSRLGLSAQIKWPNDVILERKKVAGVLMETDWREDKLQALVIGVGINVYPQAVPPADTLRYPATSVAQNLDAPLNRWEFLAAVIQEMKALRLSLTHPDFIEVWNRHLAFRNEVKHIRFLDDVIKEMEILSVREDGLLNLRDGRGDQVAIAAGEIFINKHQFPDINR